VYCAAEADFGRSTSFESDAAAANPTVEATPAARPSTPATAALLAFALLFMILPFVV
jgi:hypothetical protein